MSPVLLVITAFLPALKDTLLLVKIILTSIASIILQHVSITLAMKLFLTVNLLLLVPPHLPRVVLLQVLVVHHQAAPLLQAPQAVNLPLQVLLPHHLLRVLQVHLVQVENLLLHPVLLLVHHHLHLQVLVLHHQVLPLHPLPVLLEEPHPPVQAGHHLPVVHLPALLPLEVLPRLLLLVLRAVLPPVLVLLRVPLAHPVQAMKLHLHKLVLHQMHQYLIQYL